MVSRKQGSGYSGTHEGGRVRPFHEQTPYRAHLGLAFCRRKSSKQLCKLRDSLPCGYLETSNQATILRYKNQTRNQSNQGTTTKHSLQRGRQILELFLQNFERKSRARKITKRQGKFRSFRPR